MNWQSGIRQINSKVAEVRRLRVGWMLQQRTLNITYQNPPCRYQILLLQLTSPKVMRKHLTPYVHKVGWNGVFLIIKTKLND